MQGEKCKGYGVLLRNLKSGSSVSGHLVDYLKDRWEQLGNFTPKICLVVFQWMTTTIFPTFLVILCILRIVANTCSLVSSVVLQLNSCLPQELCLLRLSPLLQVGASDSKGTLATSVFHTGGGVTGILPRTSENYDIISAFKQGKIAVGRRHMSCSVAKVDVKV